jgi:glycosyltransferase involved in cell wall biosynthesis
MKKNKKYALLSYITHPFQLPPDHPENLRFSNIGIARSIVKALEDLEFSTDVIDYTDTSFQTFNKYDLFIAHGGINFEYLANGVAKEATKIYFSTGSYWKVHNKQEIERFDALRKRRGIELPPDRFIEASEETANQMADGIICLGNAAVKETYSQFPLVINLNNAAFHDDYCEQTRKDFDGGRKRFLFFGAVGSVHKGLDLLLEVFSKLGDLHLYVCGSVESHFVEGYQSELNRVNVHVMGWVPLRSSLFYELMDRCNFVIVPSAAEGQPGSVVECMHRGLIPVVSKECHIDTNDFGITLSSSTIEEITQVVKRLAAQPADWCAQKSQRTRQVALSDYSVEKFVENFKRAVETILASTEKTKGNYR